MNLNKYKELSFTYLYTTELLETCKNGNKSGIQKYLYEMDSYNDGSMLKKCGFHKKYNYVRH